MLKDIIPILLQMMQNKTEGIPNNRNEQEKLKSICQTLGASSQQALNYIKQIIDPVSVETKFAENPYSSYYHANDYQALLNLTRLAALFETTGDPEQQALKLAIFKGNMLDSLKYLQSYYEKYKNHPGADSISPIDACDFPLPPANESLKTWVNIGNSEDLLLNLPFRAMLEYTDGLEATTKEIDDEAKLAVIDRHLVYDVKMEPAQIKKPNSNQQVVLEQFRNNYIARSNECQKYKIAIVTEEHKGDAHSFVGAVNKRQDALRQLLVQKFLPLSEKLEILQEVRNNYFYANEAYHHYKNKNDDLTHIEKIALQAIAYERSQLLPLLLNETENILNKKIKPFKDIRKKYDTHHTHRTDISDEKISKSSQQLPLLSQDLSIIKTQPTFANANFTNLIQYEQIYLAKHPERSIQAYFNNQGMPASTINKFYALKPAMKRAGKDIRNIFIKGDDVLIQDRKTDFSPCRGYYARTLQADNPEDAKIIATAGKQSSCCQSLSGEHAEMQIVMALTGKKSKIFAIFQGDPNHPQPSDRLVAQTFMFVAKNNRLVFDSPEAEPPTLIDGISRPSLNSKESAVVLKMLQNAAMLYQPDYQAIECGFSHTSSQTGIRPTFLGEKRQLTDFLLSPIDPHQPNYEHVRHLGWSTHLRFDSQSIAYHMCFKDYAYPLGKNMIKQLSPRDLKNYDQAILNELDSGQSLNDLKTFTTTVKVALKYGYEDILDHLSAIAPDQKLKIVEYISRMRESEEKDIPENFTEFEDFSELEPGSPVHTGLAQLLLTRNESNDEDKKSMNRDNPFSNRPTFSRIGGLFGSEQPTMTRQSSTLTNTNEEPLSPAPNHQSNPFESFQSNFELTTLSENTVQEDLHHELQQAMPLLNCSWSLHTEIVYRCEFKSREEANNVGTQLTQLLQQSYYVGTHIDINHNDFNSTVTLRGFTANQLKEFLENNKNELEKLNISDKNFSPRNL